MAHGQHTTRRAFFKGAVAAIAVANVAGTAAAQLFTTEEILQMRAAATIEEYLANGVGLLVNGRENTLSKLVYVEGGLTEREQREVEKLDRRVRTMPGLRQAIIDRMKDWDRRQRLKSA